MSPRIETRPTITRNHDAETIKGDLTTFLKDAIPQGVGQASGLKLADGTEFNASAVAFQMRSPDGRHTVDMVWDRTNNALFALSHGKLQPVSGEVKKACIDRLALGGLAARKDGSLYDKMRRDMMDASGLPPPPRPTTPKLPASDKKVDYDELTGKKPAPHNKAETHKVTTPTNKGVLTKEQFLARTAGREMSYVAFRARFPAIDFVHSDKNRDDKLTGRAEWSALYDAMGGTAITRHMGKLEEMMYRPAVLLA